MLVSSLRFSPVQPTSTDKLSAGQAWTVVSFETSKKTGSMLETSETVWFRKYFCPLALAKVTFHCNVDFYLRNDMHVSELQNGDRFRKSGRNISETIWFWKSPDFDFGSISTCFDLHMFVEAPYSKSRTILGWAPKSICKEPQIVVLLCF